MQFATQLKDLSEQEWFRHFVRDELVANVPRVPPWTRESGDLEQWVFSSGQREGFLLCMSLLRVDPDE